MTVTMTFLRFTHDDWIEATELLIKTRKLLENKNNWGKGTQVQLMTKRHCLATALNAVSNGDRALFAARQALFVNIPEGFTVGNQYPSIVKFNDHSRTTHLMVLDLIDYALTSCDIAVAETEG